MLKTYEATYNIRYSEVGVFNQIKMVNILNYFQDIAASHTAVLGISAVDLFRRGLAWVVRNYKIEISKYPVWNQDITIRSWRYPAKRLYELRKYEVLDDQQNTLIEAKSSWIMINPATKRPVRLDKHLPEALGTSEKPIDFDFQNMDAPAKPQTSLPFKIRMHDLDYNRHVNNAVFVGWAVETVPQKYLKDHLPHTIEVNFLNEALYGDRIQANTQLVEEQPTPTFLHSILRESDSKELTRLKTSWGKYSADPK